jgi:hypothetical protein
MIAPMAIVAMPPMPPIATSAFTNAGFSCRKSATASAICLMTAPMGDRTLNMICAPPAMFPPNASVSSRAKISFADFRMFCRISPKPPSPAPT